MLDTLTRNLDDAIELFQVISGAQLAHLGRCSFRPRDLACHVCDDLITSQDAAWVAWIGARDRLFRYVTGRDTAREHSE